MKIVGIEGLSVHQLRDEVNRGGRFVVYGYCVSVLILTFKRSSDVTFVRAGQSPVVAGLGWTFLSLFLGWWGFPWGFIYTPMVLIQNLGGGTDVTARVMAELEVDLAPAPLTPHVSASQPASTPMVQLPPVAPTNVTPASGASGRDVLSVVLSALSLACCAPLGWIGAVLAVLSIRDAKAAGRTTPVIAIIALVLSGLSTAMLTAAFVSIGVDSYQSKRAQSAALERARAGRLLTQLDAKTACALAEASLRDGLVDFQSTWDEVRCDPTLTDDASTPSLDVTAVRNKKTGRYTACFARSSVRWYVLTIRDEPGCPAAPKLELSSSANDTALTTAEKDAQRDAKNAPSKRLEPLVQPTLGDAPADWARVKLVLSNVTTKQTPTDGAPFHKAGGTFTFFDLAPESDPTAKVRVGLETPKKSAEPFSFSELRLVNVDREAGKRFVAAVAKGFRSGVPVPSVKPRKLAPVKLAAVVLGTGLVRADEGFGTPEDGEAPGTWLTTKVFFEKDEQYAEVFFNVDLEAGVAEFSEKDEAYREDLMALLSRALVDGW